MGRNTGMHWTMIVPAISDVYQICDMALRPTVIVSHIPCMMLLKGKSQLTEIVLVAFIAIILPGDAHCSLDGHSADLVRGHSRVKVAKPGLFNLHHTQAHRGT